MAEARVWLIESRRRGPGSEFTLWWKPGGAGYTASVVEAGRFTEAEARAKARPDLDRVVPLANFRPLLLAVRQQIDAQLAALDAAEAEACVAQALAPSRTGRR